MSYPSRQIQARRTATVVEREYARALLDLAAEKGQEQSIAEELDALEELLRTEPAISRLLGSRRISAVKRMEVIQRSFAGRVSELLYRFLLVMNRHNRLDRLESVIAVYRQLLQEQRGFSEVWIETPHPLDEPFLAELRRKLQDAMQRNVLIRQQKVPALLGGIRIRVGDYVFDGSVAAQLRLLRTRLIEIGRERARLEAGA